LFSRIIKVSALAAGVAALMAGLLPGAHAADVTLLNVSYDPTRELYQAISKSFAADWKKKTGDDVHIDSSHGGSGKQARSVIDGQDADVVTLALAYDVDAIADKGLIAADWQKKLPDNATPYTSTIVFLVRKGNPKHIKDWGDLIGDGVEIITPNPKTSGGARWNYLAAYGYALRKNNGDEAKAKDFLGKLYAHVPVLDSGARGATTSFVQRGLGDVLLAWENEAILAVHDQAADFDIVVPSISILAEPPVAVVDKVVDKKGTRPVAEAFLKYLWTPEAQEIAAANFYRPRDAKAATKYAAQFPKLDLFDIQSLGGWRAVQAKHFADNGVFDQIYQEKK